MRKIPVRHSLWVSNALLCCFVLLLLSACAQQPLRPLPSELTRAPSVELAVPYFNPGNEHYCAPASISSILGYYDLPADPANVAARVFLPGREGTLQLDVRSYLRSQGLLPFRLEPSMQALLQEVEAGRPVLVLQNLGFSWWPQWHYATVIGFDHSSGHLLLHSGEHEGYRLAYATFERTWQRAGHWALLALPSGELPLDIKGKQALSTTLDALSLGRLRQPVAALAAVARRWPEQPMAWFSLGNALYQEGDYRAARTALAKSVERGQGVEAVNNLAWVSDQMGCHRNARDLVACARAVYPDFPALESTQRELALKADLGNAESVECLAISQYCPLKASDKAQ